MLSVCVVIPSYLIFNDVVPFHLTFPSCACITFYMFIFALEFTISCLALRERFNVINKFLWWRLHCSIEFLLDFTIAIFFLYLQIRSTFGNSDTAFLIIPPITSENTIRSFIRLYHCMCDAIEMINSSVSNLMIPLKLFFMMTNLFSIYNIVAVYLKSETSIGRVFLEDGSWFLMQYSVLILICYAGSSTTEASEKTKEILSKVLNNVNENKAVRKALKSFSAQINSRSLKLQTIIFTINWNLLLTVSRYSIWALKIELFVHNLPDDLNHGNIFSHNMSIWLKYQCYAQRDSK